MLIKSQSAIEMLELMPFKMAIKYSSGTMEDERESQKWKFK